jgi:hypothetical protein
MSSSTPKAVIHDSKSMCTEFAATTETELNAVLSQEMKSQQDLPWSRLPKLQRIQKLNAFCDTHAEQESMDAKQNTHLRMYLRQALDQRRIHRAKDVAYDKTTGTITSIPGLKYHTRTSRYTIKRDETPQGRTVRKKKNSPKGSASISSTQHE